jgi:UDP-N-acetylmuramoyl-tripeptide--D-alanyl-D-alanine ligase
VQPGDCFVALRGPRFDGHQYLAQAQRAGAVAALVDTPQPSIPLAQLQVKDTTQGLGAIARINRQRFTGPLVAITGSSGKTTVRAMLEAILRCEGTVLSTQGNLNNHIGVPLTLLRLDGSEQYAVIEMGASGPGEIAYLCQLARPDVALVNNVMPAHLEGFGSIEGVARAKGEIYQSLAPQGCSVINSDEPFAPMWQAQLATNNCMSFSLQQQQADCYASHIEQGATTCFELNLQGRRLPVQLQALGLHNIRNALAAACCARAVGASDQAIINGLQHFAPVAGRMSIKTGHHGSRVMDDSYNANPGSVRAAIDVLAHTPGDNLLVLGDMGELGEQAQQQHADIGRYASGKNLAAVFSCGQLSQAITANYSGSAQHFNDQQTLIAHLRSLVAQKQYTILIKGSRSARMDVVVEALTNEEHC